MGNFILSKNITPNNREILYAQSTITGQPEYLSSTSHILNVNASFSGTSSTNLTQINGNTVSTGNGAADSGTLRIALASDSTGVVRIQDGSGNNLVSTTTDPSAGARGLIVRNQPGTTTQQVNGSIASATTDTDPNTVKVGSMYNSTQPTFTDGQRAEFQIDSRGNQRMAMMVAGTNTAANFMADNNDGVATSVTTNKMTVMARETIYNGTSWDRRYSVANATNTTGTGVAAAGLLAQLDDVSPTTITENNFGNLRMSSNRNLYNTIRDAAGNERGANVNASNELNVSASSSSSTGVAVPATAFYIATRSLAGNLTGVAGGNSDALGASTIATQGYVYDGSSLSNRNREVMTATNTSGTGIPAAGILAQLDDTSPTSITENNFGNVRMAADRSLLVANRATTATVTTVAASASSVTLLAANNARKGATITNDSSAVLYVKFGATASTSSYTVTLAGSGAAPFSYYEVPFGYVGIIDGIWASATGNARITETV